MFICTGIYVERPYYFKWHANKRSILWHEINGKFPSGFFKGNARWASMSARVSICVCLCKELLRKRNWKNVTIQIEVNAERIIRFSIRQTAYAPNGKGLSILFLYFFFVFGLHPLKCILWNIPILLNFKVNMLIPLSLTIPILFHFIRVDNGITNDLISQ